jgi:hypothetical protein
MLAAMRQWYHLIREGSFTRSRDGDGRALEGATRSGSGPISAVFSKSFGTEIETAKPTTPPRYQIVLHFFIRHDFKSFLRCPGGSDCETRDRGQYVGTMLNNMKTIPISDWMFGKNSAIHHGVCAGQSMSDGLPGTK